MDRLNAARDVHMPASDAVPAKSAVREPSGLACSSLPLGAWMRASREEKGGVGKGRGGKIDTQRGGRSEE